MTETEKSPDSAPEPQPRVTLSLRLKIILGSMLIVLVAVSAMAIFLYSRSQEMNAFLFKQFDESVEREIENNLSFIVANEANDISLFFSSMKNVVEIFGTTTGAYISNEASVSLDGEIWNAYQELSQLPNGNWDNANDEPASIHLPAASTITDILAMELAALKDLDGLTVGLIEQNPEIIAIYFGGKTKETIYYPNIDLSALLPPDFDVTSRPWYVNASGLSEDNQNAVWSVPYQDAALHGLVITSSVPVYDEVGEFRGVAAIDLQIATITDRISELSVAKSGYGFLIDAQGRLIAIPETGYEDFNLTREEVLAGDIENLSLTNRVSLEVFSILAKMTSGQTGVRLVEINGSNRYIAYQPIPIIGYSLGVVVPEEELLREHMRTNTALEVSTLRTVFDAAGIIVVILSVTALAAFGLGNTITVPLNKLTQIAQDVASGNLDARSEVESRDEAGILASALNNMTETSQLLIENLEEMVEERTQVVESRAAQIQTAAEVGQAVAAQRDLEELLNRATFLISNRFNYYHVGIFLLDQRREFAVLRASNSTGGEKMIARDHKLRIGVEGIVGTVADSGEARIALNVGEDSVFFESPELDQTSSEMALPLTAGGVILGVLDLQSREINAFQEDDIPTLQVLADQLATAVQNARLLRETQEALIAARKATREVSQEGWEFLLKEIEVPGYTSLRQGELINANDDLESETKEKLNVGEIVLSEDNRIVIVPLVSRGHTIGMMRLVKPSETEPWSADEISNIESLANQISNTLDSARLFEQVQRRAAYEHVISEASTRVRETLDVEHVLQAAAREMRDALDLAEAEVWLDPDQSAGDAPDGTDSGNGHKPSE